MPTGLGDELLWLCPSLDDSPNDLSGNGNHATQATAANQPTASVDPVIYV